MGGDHTEFQREIAEAALAHTISDETEAAYRRSKALGKRRKLMDAWAQFCESGDPRLGPHAKSEPADAGRADQAQAAVQG